MFTNVVTVLVLFWLNIVMAARLAINCHLVGKDASTLSADEISLFIWFWVDVVVTTVRTLVDFVCLWSRLMSSR